MRSILTLAGLFFITHTFAQSGTWTRASSSLETRWAKDVTPSNALKEYPRPQLTRTNWTNLNGLWDYAITTKGAQKPTKYDGQILVPYPIESALSGVKKALLPEQNLWYKKTIRKPALRAGERIKLNFGAVDYQCWIYLNGKEVGTHEGGYTEFSFDITTALKAGENELLIQVYDPSDAGYGPRGKQVLKPEGIYYTPSSGIWQTVWMEVVPDTWIDKLTITPDIDQSLVKVIVKSAGHSPVSLQVDGKTIKAIKAMGFNTIRKHIKIEPARWYYHADKIGMLVWQDFVQPNFNLQAGAKEIFEKQGAEMLAQLHNHPCITTWVLFNEKWGQYDQARLTRWIKQTDPSRIVNGHSGEFLYVNGQLRSPSPDPYINADITDVHAYPDPMNSMQIDGKARVCGEFGGIGVFIPDHQWLKGSAWGYITEKPATFKTKYEIMNQHLKQLEAEGLSGSIYTQPFDVEGEQNGLMTYDREVIKIPFAELRKIHSSLNPGANSSIPQDVTAR